MESQNSRTMQNQKNKILMNDEFYRVIVNKGHQMVINPYHPKNLVHLEPDDERIKEYEKALDLLGQLTKGLKDYVLTGGLAIPATTGKWYRVHRALHLGLEIKQLPEFLDHVSHNNFYLFSRLRMRRHLMSRNQKRDIYEPITLKEISQLVNKQHLGKRCGGLEDKTENLRLIQIIHIAGNIRPHQQLFDYIDLYLHWQDEEGYLCSNDDRNRIVPDYFKGATYNTKSGEKIQVVSLEYLRQIKSERFALKNRETDSLDLEKISEYQKGQWRKIRRNE